MKSYYIFLSVFLFILNFNYSFCQESAISNPLDPGKLKDNVKFGLLMGINYPLSPSELTNKPQAATPKVQQSLLNGFDGLGFKSTYDLGIIIRYSLSKKFRIGSDISFTGWKSQINSNLPDSIWKSNNSLSMAGFALLMQYNFFGNFYITPELTYNLFNVNTTENDIYRGTVNFSKSYSRIGAGIGLGYELPVYQQFSLDIFAKARVPNLLMIHSINTNFNESQSIINSGTNTIESSILMLSLNLGLTYSFYY